MKIKKDKALKIGFAVLLLLILVFSQTSSIVRQKTLPLALSIASPFSKLAGFFKDKLPSVGLFNKNFREILDENNDLKRKVNELETALSFSRS